VTTTYTSCTGCGDTLTVEAYGQDTHPNCIPADTRINALKSHYLNAINDGDHQLADQLERQLDDTAKEPPRLLDAALTYATWGWPVFPCRPHGKAPLISRGNGGRGLLDATVNTVDIRNWWGTHPTANIGLPTGHHFDVIDVDPGGIGWWAAAHAAGHIPDVHGRVATPRGFHTYIQAAGGGNLAGLLQGIDYRGDGGYVIAPPSTVDGKRYTWTSYPSPTIKPAIKSQP
jgi:hypothetical protein